MSHHSSPETILKQYWGYDTFRPLQRDIIKNIINRTDTLALLPTGAGKSLCYQVPALMQDGLCLVISPLIALMQDQVARLRGVGVKAACLHSGMFYNNVRQTLEYVVQGVYKLLYISPERLQTELFREYLPDLDIKLIAIDEAHCISQWGYDFRPDYLKIAQLRAIFEDVPMLALTASATDEVQGDIIKELKLKSPAVFKQTFARPNLYYSIQQTEGKQALLLQHLRKDECSLIYCRSRRQTETVARQLVQAGFSAAHYHAGMGKDKREAAQQAWMQGKAHIMVATTAFGMGIDKPDVRNIIHYDIPEHMEAYYQEAGRAGRDGKHANVSLLYNAADIKRLHESTALQFPPEEYLRHIYQAVVEYLQIPIGTQPDKYYPFELQEFCKRFDLAATPASYALRLLQQDGLWTMTEAAFAPATAMFVTDRYAIDTLANSYPQLHYVATGMLRMYSTIFHHPSVIRIAAIAKQLRLTMTETEQALHQLQGMEILEYNKPVEGAQMFFNHYRVDSRHLIINHERINRLRKRHESRTKAIIDYVRNNAVCRERTLLEYFGEQVAKDCHHCDVCRSKDVVALPEKELRQRIEQLLGSGSMNVQQMAARLPIYMETIVNTVRHMIDEQLLQVSPDGKITLMNK